MAPFHRDAKHKQNDSQPPAPADTLVRDADDEQVKREGGSAVTGDGGDKNADDGKSGAIKGKHAREHGSGGDGNNTAQGDLKKEHEVQTVATESSSSTTSVDATSSGKVTQMDAKNFIAELKKRVGSGSETYTAFLAVLRRYHDRKVKTDPVMRRVASLLSDHPDLVIGFETFLPKGNSMARFVTGNNGALPPDSGSRKSSPLQSQSGTDASSEMQANRSSSVTDADAPSAKCTSDAATAPPAKASTSQPADGSSSSGENLPQVKSEPGSTADQAKNPSHVEGTGGDGSKPKSPV